MRAHRRLHTGRQGLRASDRRRSRSALVLVALLAAACTNTVVVVCPTAAPTQAPSGPSPSASTVPGVITCAPNCTYRDMVVGFVQTGSEGGWRSANTESFRRTAQDWGVKLKFYDPSGAVTAQASSVRAFIADPEVNVIVLAALETTGWDEVLAEARAAGKIVVLEDRRIDAPEDLYATYVGSDFVEEGRQAGRAMVELLGTSSSKRIWELVGNVGSTAARDRGQGFREAIKGSGIEIARSATADWSSLEGKQVMAGWLKTSKDLVGLIAQNDEMGLGAIQALREAGLKPGADVKIVSFDAASKAAFNAMLAGELNVDVECNPRLGPQVYEAALKALNGETLPKWIPSSERVYRSTDGDLQEAAARWDW